MNYDPKGNGKDKAVGSVVFNELEPPQNLRGIVHRFLELKTDGVLADDYRFHALPDACTYLVFDQRDAQITGVSRLCAASQEFNLGRAFHFINIRFLPGVWQDTKETISYGMLDTPYQGALPFVDFNRKLAIGAFADQVEMLSEIVESLIASGMVTPNPMIAQIFNHLDNIHNVANMADVAGLSPRQLQRRLKQTTGFTPHDFLKIIRLQMTLGGGDIDAYADQSHFIHSFRNATGYTPTKYARKFDV
jgi:AraC-like DNA-binding protein